VVQRLVALLVRVRALAFRKVRQTSSPGSLKFELAVGDAIADKLRFTAGRTSKIAIHTTMSRLKEWYFRTRAVPDCCGTYPGKAMTIALRCLMFASLISTRTSKLITLGFFESPTEPHQTPYKRGGHKQTDNGENEQSHNRFQGSARTMLDLRTSSVDNITA
jgi:hypothetical protein